jgi:hypothetical protein
VRLLIMCCASWRCPGSRAWAQLAPTASSEWHDNALRRWCLNSSLTRSGSADGLVFFQKTKNLGLVCFVSVCLMSLSLAAQTGDVLEV